MGFNWLTFLAQIVNLFVLAWLMKRYLYRPIIDAITKRQKYISDRVKAAEEASEDAKKREQELNTSIDDWQKSKQNRQDELFKELAKQKHQQEELLAEELQKARQKMQANLNRELQSAEITIRDMMAKNFMDLSQKVLSDLSGLSQMEQALTLFQKKVNTLSKSEISNIKKSIKNKSDITVYSSNTLTKKEIKQLTDFLFKTFEIRDIEFVKNSDLILGIEVVIGETVLEWNLKTYLDTFKDNLSQALSNLMIKE